MNTFQITFPLTNQEFLKVISNSFNEFLDSGTSRSTRKLKPLHGAIAQDLANKLGSDYVIKSQGYHEDREGSIKGRYMDKNVDITIEKEGCAIAGIAVKFVMQNYSQNSNNYFENMLGETANIRSNQHPYFQIFIILDKLPYYKTDKTIFRWEPFTMHNVQKYITLSKDDTDIYFHTPNKTLLYIIHIPDNELIYNAEEYIDYYKRLNADIKLSNSLNIQHGNSLIINDYALFIDKVYHTIRAL